MSAGLPPQSEERVLSTLNKDGSRRWLRPKVSAGTFLTWRRVVAYALMLVFTVLPYLRINGKPSILLDLPQREFTLFGTTFLPTDTLLLAFLFLSILVSIFLLTALLGRVWCGWACPQTVYMEFLYRPIERLFDGRNYRTGGKAEVAGVRRVLKYVVYLLLSMFLAHTFLAYFVGVETLFRWVRGSPFEHPTAFLVMAFTTGLMMFDFCFFREQICTLMCPYGRFQSVLLDRQSLIISYDGKRGEPRGRMQRAKAGGAGAPDAKGDCIDCNLCVVTCPTGIDIRDGLQMECIGCAQCVDACDAVMDKVNRPRGLIRYGSQEAMESGRRRLFRPRVVIYPLALLLVLTGFGVTLASRETAHVSFLRLRATPYSVLESGAVATSVLIKITNRSEVHHVYEVAIDEAPGMTSPDLPLQIDPGASGQATLRLVLPGDRFERGRAEITVRVNDEAGFAGAYGQHVLGPLFPGAAPVQAAGSGEKEKGT